MIHGPGQIGIGKCDPAEWCVAQDLPGGRSALLSEEETRLRAQVGMAPAVQNNAGDIAPRVEAGAGEHCRELFADLLLIVPERSTHQLAPAAIPLLFGGISRV